MRPTGWYKPTVTPNWPRAGSLLLDVTGLCPTRRLRRQTRGGAQSKPKSGPRAADQTQANKTDAEQCGRSGFGNVRNKGYGVDDGAAVGECPCNGGGILNSSGLVNERTGHRIEDWTTFYIRYELNRPTTLNEGEEEHVADGAKARFTYIQGTQTSRDTYGIRRGRKTNKTLFIGTNRRRYPSCRIDDCDITRLQIYRDNPPSRVESLVAKCLTEKGLSDFSEL
jgi:hypothetical protein